MSLESPKWVVNAAEFELAVGEILEDRFRFGLLSKIPLFNGESREEDLFATELDHLVHYRHNGIDYLVIVECKNQELTSTNDRKSSAPKGNSKWYVHYSKKNNGRVTWKASETRYQLRRQADALLQILEVDPGHTLVVECWVVHRRKDCQHLTFNPPKGPKFKAFNVGQLKTALENLDQVEVVSRNRSIYLAQLERGIPRQGAPHPPIPDALDYISKARKPIDSNLFKRFNGWFHSKKNLWAIKGTAGSGKSVLMAYTLAVLATNHRIVFSKKNDEYILEESSDFMPEGIPAMDERSIYAYAMSRFQLESLQHHYQNFLEFLVHHSTTGQPATRKVVFKIWDGSIPDEATCIIIDEAHDLTTEHQETIATWHNTPKSERYLIIGLDRQQHTRIHSTSKRPFIKGLNFSRSHSMLSRTYRSPISVFMTGKALLFRWYSKKGPMIRPGLIKPEQKFQKFYTFKGGIGVKVEHDDQSNDCRIWIRNDTHPSNYWNKTVDLFESGRELADILKLERVQKDQVMWLRFDGQDHDIEDRYLSNQFEYHRVSPTAPEEFIDQNIKGLEFPIVVIEGLPTNFDNWSVPEKLWQARRLLYICATRATGFLYFILNGKGNQKQPYEELKRILAQFETSTREGYEAGETWCMDFNWRPKDLVELSDYDDG